MTELLAELNALDIRWFHALNSVASVPALDDFMTFVTSKWPWLLAGLAALAWAVKTRQPKIFKLCLLVGLTLGITDLLTFRVLKPTIARPRPCYQLPDVHLLQPSCGSDFGMPSNHAANAMATATLLALMIRRRWTLGLFAAAALIGVSRIYVGAHFPGDVLAGFAFGALVAALVFKLSQGAWFQAFSAKTERFARRLIQT